MITKYERAQRLADNLSMEGSIKKYVRRYGTGKAIATIGDQFEGDYSDKDIAPEFNNKGLRRMRVAAGITSLFNNHRYHEWVQLNDIARKNPEEVVVFESGFK